MNERSFELADAHWSYTGFLFSVMEDENGFITIHRSQLEKFHNMVAQHFYKHAVEDIEALNPEMVEYIKIGGSGD